MGVMVKLAQPSVDADRDRHAGERHHGAPGALRVGHQRGTGMPSTVACRGPADCELALRRLREDTTHFEAVQRDERKRIVSP